MQSLVHPHIERVISTYDVVTRDVPRELSFTMLLVGEEDFPRYIERIQERGILQMNPVAWRDG